VAYIAVIGTGYVGSVSGACLADFGNHVICVDNNEEKIEALKQGKIPIFEPGLDVVIERNVRSGRLSFTTDLSSAVKANPIVFIAVGTPPADDGSADLCYVEEAARAIAYSIERYTIIVNKSTVPVGTGRLVKRWVSDELEKRGVLEKIPFDVVSNPEFLREGSAVYDFIHPDRIVIGAESEKACSIIKEVYRALYLNETPFIETNLESAELIKYASNAFLAVKISFINEVANLCEKVGANIEDVAKAIGRDGRIGSKFLHPGPGYGGSCFPKDTQALTRIGRDCGVPLLITETTIKSNEAQKTRMIDKIVAGMNGSLVGKTIAILGLAFKPNTDDMREAAALMICEGLVWHGVASLRVWDPAAMNEAVWRLASIKDHLLFATDEYDAIAGADALVLLTEWNQLRNLELDKVKTLLKGDAFFDLRNIYKRHKVEATGLRYFGVGK
jgi:UDPglucose 6-dehydrogenase